MGPGDGRLTCCDRKTDRMPQQLPSASLPKLSLQKYWSQMMYSVAKRKKTPTSFQGRLILQRTSLWLPPPLHSLLKL